VFINYKKSCFSLSIALLLLIQIVSSSANLLDEYNIEDDVFLVEGNEFVVSFDHVISPVDWEYIEGLGAVPLRLKEHREMIVWYEGVGDSLHGNGIVGVEVEGGAPFLGDVNYFGNVKVVLEPRINQNILDNVLNVLQYNGIFVKNNDGGGVFDNFIVEGVGISEIEMITEIPGILWVEEIYLTEGRNTDSASILSGVDRGGINSTNLAWEFGLSAQGIIIGVADSGIDRDHACFRNSTDSMSIGNENGDSLGTPGELHRKIILMNDSIDYWDSDSHTQGGHGTHVMGTISCHDVNLERSGLMPGANMTAMGYNSKLVIQDIVNESGWVPPSDVDLLLYESTIGGAVISSYSWGDSTTAYTTRSHDLDAWARENPWSIAFIAPGNTGGQLLEPANARSVVAVGASTKDGGIYGSSSIGNTSEETRGIFMLAPGVNIISADSDGIDNSLNDGWITKTGTSMATPMAASYAGVIQQLIEDGWITFYDEQKTNITISNLAPNWANSSDDEVALGSGFTPSGSLLRALIALSSEGLEGENHQGNVVGLGPDYIQGWGQPNLSKLIDLDEIKKIRDNGINNEIYYPNNDIWVWDSYRLEDNDWSSLISERVDSSNNGGTPLDRLVDVSWNGSGAVGPFLATNDEVKWKFEKENYTEDIEIVLSWTPKPYPEPADSLRLVLEMSNGEWFYGGNLDESGWSTDQDCANIDCNGGEVTSKIKVPASELEDIEWVRVWVEGAAITSGPENGTVGINGNKIGFALVMKGVGDEIEYIPPTKMEDWFDSGWEKDWGALREEERGDLFKNSWNINTDNNTLQGLWPEWVSVSEGVRTNVDPLVDGLLLVNMETHEIYGVSEEELGVSVLTDNLTGGLTFPMGDLLNLDNVTINALKINIVSEDWNFGMNEEDIVVGVGNSDTVNEMCCSSIQKDGVLLNSVWPGNDIEWNNIGKVVENIHQSEFLFTQIRWPSEFSGNLSLDISIKINENGDLALLSLPISVYREIDGELNDIFVEGVIGWEYDNGVNLSINSFSEPNDMVWNFTENPGKLTVILDIAQPRLLEGVIKNAERGLVEYSNLPGGVFLPFCVDGGEMVEEMGGIRSIDLEKNNGSWAWQDVWLPPSLWDCKGNIVEFEGVVEMEIPPALVEWNILASELNGEYVSYKVDLDFSNIMHPWLDEDGIHDNAPDGVMCNLNLKYIDQYQSINYQSINCENLKNNTVDIDERINYLEFEFNWKEGVDDNSGDRIVLHQFEINNLEKVELKDNVGITIIQKEMGVEIKWGNGLVPENGWPVFVYDESHDFAHIFILKNEEVRFIEVEGCEGDLDFYGFEGYVPWGLDLVEGDNSVNWGVEETADIVGEFVSVSVIEYNENISFQIGISGDNYILLGEDATDGVEISVEMFQISEGLMGIECSNDVVSTNSDVGGWFGGVDKIVFIWIVITSILAFGFILERKRRGEKEDENN